MLETKLSKEATAKVAARLKQLVDDTIAKDMTQGIPADYEQIVKRLIDEKLMSFGPEINKEILTKAFSQLKTALQAEIDNLWQEAKAKVK